MVDTKVMQAVLSNDLKKVLTAATNTCNIAMRPASFRVSSLYDPKEQATTYKGECMVCCEGREGLMPVMLCYSQDREGRLILKDDHTKYAADLVNTIQSCEAQPNTQKVTASTAVMAADGEDTEEDFGASEEEFSEDPDTESTADAVDTLTDAVDELQDTVEEVQEDDPSIEIDNNIENHYIAECDRCHGVFISALVEADHEVSKISGICPLCEKESDQQLKWIVRSVKKEELL